MPLVILFCDGWMDMGESLPLILSLSGGWTAVRCSIELFRRRRQMGKISNVAESSGGLSKHLPLIEADG